MERGGISIHANSRSLSSPRAAALPLGSYLTEAGNDELGELNQHASATHSSPLAETERVVHALQQHTERAARTKASSGASYVLKSGKRPMIAPCCG